MYSVGCPVVHHHLHFLKLKRGNIFLALSTWITGIFRDADAHRAFIEWLAVNSVLATVTARWACYSKKNGSFEEPIWKVRLAESILIQPILRQIEWIPGHELNDWPFKPFELRWLGVHHFYGWKLNRISGSITKLTDFAIIVQEIKVEIFTLPVCFSFPLVFHIPPPPFLL